MQESRIQCVCARACVCVSVTVSACVYIYLVCARARVCVFVCGWVCLPIRGMGNVILEAFVVENELGQHTVCLAVSLPSALSPARCFTGAWFGVSL